MTTKTKDTQKHEDGPKCRPRPLYIEDATWAKVEQVAKIEDRAENRIIRRAVLEYVDRVLKESGT